MSSTLPPLEARISTLIELIAESHRACKACHATIYFVRHRNRSLAPYTLDGLNHFLTCPDAKEFKKGAAHAASTEA